jgi:hypothetical protein
MTERPVIAPAEGEIARGAPADEPRRHLAAQEVIELGEEADLIAEARPARFESLGDDRSHLFRIA